MSCSTYLHTQVSNGIKSFYNEHIFSQGPLRSSVVFLNIALTPINFAKLCWPYLRLKQIKFGIFWWFCLENIDNIEKICFA